MVLADSTSHSPLCRVSWTDVVHGIQHSWFGSDEEVELRFGLELDQNFWSSFETSQFFISFCVYQYGGLVTRFDQDGDTRQQLPGAPATRLWIGLTLGRARQTTFHGSGLVQFRPQVFFMRQSGGNNLVGEYAVAPHDHTFMVDSFSPVGGGFDGESLVGGAGVPDGTPTSEQ